MIKDVHYTVLEEVVVEVEGSKSTSTQAFQAQEVVEGLVEPLRLVLTVV